MVGWNTPVGSVHPRMVALASVGCLMSNRTAPALRTRHMMYSTNRGSPYSGLLVVMSNKIYLRSYPTCTRTVVSARLLKQKA